MEHEIKGLSEQGRRILESAELYRVLAEHGKTKYYEFLAGVYGVD